MGNTLHYTKAVGSPDAFKSFTDIPHSSDTLRIANLSSFAVEGVAGNLSGLRYVTSSTITMKPSDRNTG
jgi:hypothetical protein